MTESTRGNAAVEFPDAARAMRSAARALAMVLLAGAIAVCSVPAKAASVVLNAASATSVRAMLVPDVGDVGTAAGIWMGAVYQGVLYMRSGNAWVPYSGGPLPLAISGQTLFSSTLVSVVEQLDISALVGLDIYVGYGTSEQDMLTSPGKMAKVYTVTGATTADAANAVPISVDAGPLGQRITNIPYVSVTVCSPGSAGDCHTIDHVIVDTGSTGLRLMSSVVPGTLALPMQRDSGGNPYGECVQFADGSAVWGTVRKADVRMAGELAASLPIQIVGDPLLPSIPAGCSGIPSNSVETFGANGIIGLGYFREDCGTDCAQNAANGQYYACPATGCIGATMTKAQQVAHPVPLFAGDNNGVVIQLPVVPAAGAATASGSLLFGIGTRPNNGLGAANVQTVDATRGYFTTLYGGAAYINSYVDSGSSVLFLPRDLGIQACSSRSFAYGFLCPSVTVKLSAFNHGTNGALAAVDFSVANASVLLGNSQLSAFNNLAAPNSDAQSFDWGLPFFYGRIVFTAIENAATPGGTGPYVAY